MDSEVRKRSGIGGKPARHNASPRNVVFLAYPRVLLLDFAGPWEVFHTANYLSGPGPAAYALNLVSSSKVLTLESSAGLPVVAGRTLSNWRGPIDTLVVPAAAGSMNESHDPTGLRQLRKIAGRSRRVVSICLGAFQLASAGLLDGRRATTHWSECKNLADRFPNVKVEPDAIFVKDGNVYTSAGVTAGMDLALALVEEDLGREIAFKIARQMVMFVRRPGGQTQFSASLESQIAEQGPIRDLLAWASDNLGANLSVEALAGRAHMSLRNFSRVFCREIGQTPARYVERLRVDAARQRIEETIASFDQIAGDCGFGSADAMRIAFLRLLKVTPTAYRERFSHGG